MSESVVLCEGYHDRAFWAGWLEHLGCVDRGRGHHPRVPVFDPEGREVTGPQFGYYTSSDVFVRQVACQGKSNVMREARKRLDEQSQRMRQGASEPRLIRLVLSIDPDLPADEPSTKTGFQRKNLESFLTTFDSSAERTDTEDVLLFGGATTVSLIRWEIKESIAPGVPVLQTLERMVCASLVAAYPERAEPVQRWLDSRPNAPAAGPKEFAWSHMAGWYAEFGCTAFYQKLWNDDQVIGRLRSRLELCGAWQLAEELAK